jgi:putative ABC transport system permease protein
MPSGPRSARALAGSRALVLTESLLLAAGGAVAALLFAHWTGGLTRSMLAERVPHVEAISIDWWVLAFNAALAAAVGVLSGVASIVAVRSVGFAGTFNYGSGRSSTSRMPLRRSLLAAEVAVTFLLVVTAALLSQTLWNLYHSNRGFDGSRVITAAVERPNMAGTIPELQHLLLAFFSNVTEQISSLPGVSSAAAASNVPLFGGAMGMSGYRLWVRQRVRRRVRPSPSQP